MEGKIKSFQACHAERRVFSVVVKSSSDHKTEYKISGYFVDGQLECTCPGFRFRGTCKHANLQVESCGWNSVDSREPQTFRQRENHICPRCGSKTIDTVRGNF